MKKLSDAFLEFIEPIFPQFGNPLPMTEPYDAVCAIGHLVWNAVILQELNPLKNYIADAKALGGNVPAINELIDLLARRKKECFGADKRIIGLYDIRKQPDGSFSLWAQIHDDSVMQ